MSWGKSRQRAPHHHHHHYQWHRNINHKYKHWKKKEKEKIRRKRVQNDMFAILGKRRGLLFDSRSFIIYVAIYADAISLAISACTNG